MRIYTLDETGKLWAVTWNWEFWKRNSYCISLFNIQTLVHSDLGVENVCWCRGMARVSLITPEFTQVNMKRPDSSPFCFSTNLEAHSGLRTAIPG